MVLMRDCACTSMADWIVYFSEISVLSDGSGAESKKKSML